MGARDHVDFPIAISQSDVLEKLFCQTELQVRPHLCFEMLEQ